MAPPPSIPPTPIIKTHLDHLDPAGPGPGTPSDLTAPFDGEGVGGALARDGTRRHGGPHGPSEAAAGDAGEEQAGRRQAGESLSPNRRRRRRRRLFGILVSGETLRKRGRLRALPPLDPDPILTHPLTSLLPSPLSRSPPSSLYVRPRTARKMTTGPPRGKRSWTRRSSTSTAWGSGRSSRT